MNWAALFTIYGFLSPDCYCCSSNWSIDIAANFPFPHTWINHNLQSTIQKFKIQKIKMQKNKNSQSKKSQFKIQKNKNSQPNPRYQTLIIIRSLRRVTGDSHVLTLGSRIHRHLYHLSSSSCSSCSTLSSSSSCCSSSWAWWEGSGGSKGGRIVSGQVQLMLMAQCCCFSPLLYTLCFYTYTCIHTLLPNLFTPWQVFFPPFYTFAL